MDPNQPNQPPGYQPPGYVPPPPAGPYSQPMGQQSYNQYGAQYGAPPPTSRWGANSLGMDSNIAAGLGYLFPIIGVIFFFVERTNRYVKFNAAQATLLAIGGFILGVLYVFGGVFTLIGERGGAGAFGLLLSCPFGLLGLGLLALQIWGIVIGFTGQYVKFPVIGQIAEQWAGGPPAPVY
jgi:uncharacterized membrane protein